MAKLHITPIFTRSAEVTSTILIESVTATIGLTAEGTSMGQDSCGREIRNFCFPAGDNPVIVLTVKNTATDTPIDIAGATAKLTVATITDDGVTRTVTELFSLTGVAQSPSTDGKFHFSPTTTQANSGGVGDYRYDTQVTFSDGTRRTVTVGDWVYEGDISDTGAN